MSLHRVNQVLCQFNDLDTISLAEPATRAWHLGQGNGARLCSAQSAEHQHAPHAGHQQPIGPQKSGARIPICGKAGTCARLIDFTDGYCLDLKVLWGRAVQRPLDHAHQNVIIALGIVEPFKFKLVAEAL